MGLSFRRRSGRIADGSKLIVPGQITTGVKVFPNSFEYKKGSKNENLGPGVEVLLTQTPLPQPSATPSPTPTPTPTPQTIIDSILVTENIYLSVGENEYLEYKDPI